jgi:hypothetical protein
VSGVVCHVVPAADVYCTDQPVTGIVFALRLNSSMKSLRSVAPELPPPPYTWLMTTSPGGGAGGGGGGGSGSGSVSSPNVCPLLTAPGVCVIGPAQVKSP